MGVRAYRYANVGNEVSDTLGGQTERSAFYDRLHQRLALAQEWAKKERVEGATVPEDASCLGSRERRVMIRCEGCTRGHTAIHPDWLMIDPFLPFDEIVAAIQGWSVDFEPGPRHIHPDPWKVRVVLRLPVFNGSLVDRVGTGWPKPGVPFGKDFPQRDEGV